MPQLRVISASDHPELVQRANAIDGGFYAYNFHGEVFERLWGSLSGRFPACQLALYDDASGAVLGVGNTIPCRWDGREEDLPWGIDEVLERGFAEGSEKANALSALLIKISPDQTGRGLSRLLIAAMSEVAATLGYANLIAPIRPNWKDRYPITPIEEYVRWTRADGLPFDPWIRVHCRLGADMLRVAPESCASPAQ